MCLTVPQRVDEVRGKTAKMQDGRWVKTDLVGMVKKGDMLLVQANLAVERVPAKRARAMKQIMEDSYE